MKAGLLPDACVRRLKGLSVAIVGGGFAGMSAARLLCRRDVKVTVFEARAQVGGRVLSDTTFSRGRITEVGAELVGSIHTRWCALAIEYGLALISRMDEDLYRGQGLAVKLRLHKDLSMPEIRALGREMEDRVLRPIAKEATVIRDAARPWLQAATLKRFDDMSVADALTTLYRVKRTEPLWKAVEMLLVNNNVKSLETLNFLGLLCLVRGGQPSTIDDKDPLMGYWNELEIYRCADGCQRLALDIAKDITNKLPDSKPNKVPATVHVRRAVRVIDFGKRVDGKPVAISSRPVLGSKDGKPVFGSPTVEGFDYVIFSIPPSVWDDVEIKPIHPSSSVGKMEMGGAVKFFNDVDRRFWIRDGAAPYGGSLSLGQVWEGTDNQTRTSGQGIVLSVFAGGRTPMPTADQLEKGLVDLYPKLLRHRTKAPLFANWPQQPFIRTGYVSPGKGQILTVGRKLHEVFQSRLFFAGEHTQLDHFGYMEGALRSGERAANHLIRIACDLPPPQEPATESPIRVAEHDDEAVLDDEVLGNDERTRVTDTLRMPNRWICAIDVLVDNPAYGNGGPRYLSKSRGTGVLIGPRHVLTAGHVLDPQSVEIDGTTTRAEVRRLVVSPARNGDNTKHPFGQATSVSFHRARAPIRRLVLQDGRTIDQALPRDDYALVVVDRDLSAATHARLAGRLGFWGSDPAKAQVRRLDPAAIHGRDVNITGYPGDRCGNDRIDGNASEKQRRIANCARRRPDEWASTQWQSSGVASVDAATTTLFHTADTYSGQSGGPICIGADGRIALIAIHTAPAGARNQGVRVTRRMLRELCGWINADAGREIATIEADGLVVRPMAASQREAFEDAVSASPNAR